MGLVKVDTCGPPSQLQQALKENTKVDAEYDEITGVPKTRANKTKQRVRVHQMQPTSKHSIGYKEGVFSLESIPSGRPQCQRGQRQSAGLIN